MAERSSLEEVDVLGVVDGLDVLELDVVALDVVALDVVALDVVRGRCRG